MFVAVLVPPVATGQDLRGLSGGVVPRQGLRLCRPWAIHRAQPPGRAGDPDRRFDRPAPRYRRGRRARRRGRAGGRAPRAHRRGDRVHVAAGRVRGARRVRLLDGRERRAGSAVARHAQRGGTSDRFAQYGRRRAGYAWLSGDAAARGAPYACRGPDGRARRVAHPPHAAQPAGRPALRDAAARRGRHSAHVPLRARPPRLGLRRSRRGAVLGLGAAHDRELPDAKPGHDAGPRTRHPARALGDLGGGHAGRLARGLLPRTTQRESRRGANEGGTLSDMYVHGYRERENERLQDQAGTLVDLLHSDTAYPRGSSVLEAGCGVGAQTVTLAQRSPEARFTSVDVSADSIAEAQRRTDRAGLTNVEFQRADIFDLPFDAESFDHVFVCFVLEHLSQPVKALTVLNRLLRPGGSITVIEGDHGSTYFHPDSAAAHAAIRCQIELQRAAGGTR